MVQKLMYPVLAVGLAASIGMAKEVLIDDFEIPKDPLKDSTSFYLHTWDDVEGEVGNENGNIYLAEAAADSSNYGIGFFGRTLDEGVTVHIPVGVIGACTEYTYQYKGAAHQFVLVPDKANDDNMHYTDIKKLIPATDEWTVAHIKPTDTRDRYGWGSYHLDPSTVVRVRWNINHDAKGDYLYIDNLKCIRPDGYIIAFYNVDTLVKTQIVPEGEMPVDPGLTPKKESSANYDYYFKTWEPAFVAATEKTSYHAVYDSTLIYTLEEGESILVQDFEDCEAIDGCVNKWNGAFWLDSDAGNGGAAALSSDTTEETSTVAKLTYLLKQDTSTSTAPYARAVMNVNDIGSRTLSTCEVIKYDYKGAAHNFRVRSSYDVGGNYHMKSVEEGDTWKTELISVATQLKQQNGWGIAVNIADAMKRAEAFDWDIQGEFGTEGSLEIDNIRCINLPVYTITFMDGENKIEEQIVTEGDVPKCNFCNNYAKYVKQPTESHKYVYTGEFDPEVVAANQDATYQVVWDSTLRTFTVTFVSEGDTLATGEWDYGVTPSYEGTPVKAATAQYTYTFKGWDKELVEVTDAATYTALFDSTLNKFLVMFDVGDKIDSAEYDYGTKAEDITVPEAKKAVTAQYTYTFKAWDKELADVTENATYTALFDSTVNKYLVTFVVDSKKDSAEYVYGTKADSLNVPETKMAATAQFTYTFKAWDKELADVTETATYTAVFDSTVNKYLVKFVVDGKVDSAKYAYGTKAADLKVPETKKASTDRYTFTFKKWDEKLADVTKNATYTAVFDSTVNRYLVKFVSEGKTLDSAYYAYGTKANKIDIPNATKKDTKDSTFTFDGWDAKIANVTKDVTYTAKFKAEKIESKKDSKSDVINVVAQNNFKFSFANNELTIVQPNPSMVRVQVFDMLGHKVESFNDQIMGSKSFGLAHLPQGFYMVRIASRSQQYTAKVTIR